MKRSLSLLSPAAPAAALAVLTGCGLTSSPLQSTELPIIDTPKGFVFRFVGPYPTTFNNIDNNGAVLRYSGPAQPGCIVYGPYKRINRAGKYEFYLDFEARVIPTHQNETRKSGSWWHPRVSVDRRSNTPSFDVDVNFFDDPAQRIVQTFTDWTTPRRPGDGEKKGYGIGTKIFTEGDKNIEIRICNMQNIDRVEYLNVYEQTIYQIFPKRSGFTVA